MAIGDGIPNDGGNHLSLGGSVSGSAGLSLRELFRPPGLSVNSSNDNGHRQLSADVQLPGLGFAGATSLGAYGLYRYLNRNKKPQVKQADEEQSLRPVYENKSFLKKLPGRALRSVTTPLVGLSGATAGAVGLGLAGTMAGALAGHHVSPDSHAEIPSLDPEDRPGHKFDADIHGLKKYWDTGNIASVRHTFPSLDKYLEDASKAVGGTAANLMGGPEKLKGSLVGAGIGGTAGGAAGLLGGGIGGAYLGYRAGGGGRPKKIEKLVLDKGDKEKKSFWLKYANEIAGYSADGSDASSSGSVGGAAGAATPLGNAPPAAPISAPMDDSVPISNMPGWGPGPQIGMHQQPSLGSSVGGIAGPAPVGPTSMMGDMATKMSCAKTLGAVAGIAVARRYSINRK